MLVEARGQQDRVNDERASGHSRDAEWALPRGGGFIVNISSLAGRNPFSGGAAYNASKFGLNGFTEALMLDHRHDNVRVSSIMPGSVDTEFSRRSSKAEWKIAPEDVADVVVMALRMPARTTVSRIEMRPGALEHRAFAFRHLMYMNRVLARWKIL